MCDIHSVCPFDRVFALLHFESSSLLLKMIYAVARRAIIGRLPNAVCYARHFVQPPQPLALVQVSGLAKI